MIGDAELGPGGVQYGMLVRVNMPDNATAAVSKATVGMLRFAIFGHSTGPPTASSAATPAETRPTLFSPEIRSSEAGPIGSQAPQMRPSQGPCSSNHWSWSSRPSGASVGYCLGPNCARQALSRAMKRVSRSMFGNPEGGGN